MYKYTILHTDGTTDELVAVGCDQKGPNYQFYGMESSIYDMVVINRDTVKKITATEITHCDGAIAFN